MVKDKQQRVYEFAGFRANIAEKRLRRGENLIQLTPKEFDVLLMLIENAGQLVEKERLLEKIWENTYVQEGTLTRNISWLRKKLAAHSEEDLKIIETVPKIGYRLLSPVTLVENAPNEKACREEKAESPVSVLEETPVKEKPLSLEKNFVETLPAPAAQAALAAADSHSRHSQFWALLALPLIIGAAYLALRSFPPQTPETPRVPRTAPSSGLPGRETSPAFSPDGKHLVYSWDNGIEDGNSDIYIKLVGTGESLRLTTNSANEINPVFSPDGKSIAFVRIFPTHNEIILMSALGDSERKLYEQVSYASVSFSPDGRRLAAAKLDSAGQEAGIFTLDLESGAKTVVTAPPAPASDHAPRFAPDGKSIAFTRYFTNLRREIFVAPVTDGEAR